MKELKHYVILKEARLKDLLRLRQDPSLSLRMTLLCVHPWISTISYDRAKYKKTTTGSAFASNQAI